MKLTAKAVTSLQLPTGKTDHIEWDDEKGFGYRLRLGAGGKLLRSWIIQYRHAGATRRVTLDKVLSAEAARTAAKKLLAQVALGADPQADKRNRRDKDVHTFRATVTDFLAMKEREVRQSTHRELTRYLTGAYFKALHSVPVDKITRQDVAAALNRISLQSGAIVAAHARTTLSGLFSWALQQGLCENNNPVIGTAKPKGSQSRERVLTDSELAAIWRACGDDEYGRCIKLLILTGARRAEIGAISWSELDFERGTWTLPASRSKNKRPHTLPLLPAMRAVIESVLHVASRDRLFGQRGDQGFTAWSPGKRALDARLGDQVRPWVVHDVRRSVATKMADIGISPHIIETVLNHQSGHKSGPAGIYNRSSYEREVRAALALWEDHVCALVEGGQRKVLSFGPKTAS